MTFSYTAMELGEVGASTATEPGVGLLLADGEVMRSCNAAFEELFGALQQRPDGQDLSSLFVSQSHYRQCLELLHQRGAEGSVNARLRRGNEEVLCRVRCQHLEWPPHGHIDVWQIEDITARVAQARALELARHELQEQEQARLRALVENQIILDSAAVGIVYLKNRQIVRCNPAAESIFGCPPGGMNGRSTREWYLSDEDFERTGAEFYPALVAGRTYTNELTLTRRNGEQFWCRLTGQILDPRQPLSGGSIWVLEDLTERHAAEEALRSAQSMMQAIFDCAKVSIIVTDWRGVIRMANSTALVWLGYQAEELIGQQIPQVLHDPAEIAAYAEELGQRLQRPVQPAVDALGVVAREFGSDGREWSYVRKDGSRLPVHLTTSVLRSASGSVTGYIGVAVDITDRRRADDAMRLAQLGLEERIATRTAELARSNAELAGEVQRRRAIEEQMRQMAHYDQLTGLPNRNLLFTQLHQAVAQARRLGRCMAVLFIDLDGFKRVNDTLGHDVGDQLLTEVAARMRAVLRDGDTLARHGGDEFVLLVPEYQQRNELETLCQRLLAAFAGDLTIGGHALRSSPSIGVACLPAHGEDGETLLRHADTAMYAAKAAGRNCFRFYEPAMSVNQGTDA